MKLRKEEWGKASMGSSLFKIIDGDRGNNYPKTSEFLADGYCLFLNAKNVTKGGFVFNECQFITKEKDKQLRKGNLFRNDFVITTRGTIGNIAYFNKDVVYQNIRINSGMVIFRIVSEEINHYYLYSALKLIFEERNITKYITGTAQPQLPIRTINQIQIPLPPLEEQIQIAALFQSIETAIEQVKGQETNLLKLKNKLLDDLFSGNQQFGNHLQEEDFETVTFDEVVINISERIEPKKTELTTYVGLEHLDADNLKIERTGTPDDVIGTKLKIYKGDIIFGKRRAYQRKVAVSHFDGIASAHSMILRTDEKNIEKDFLPFFMQSDAFMNRAVQISEGSLSPTIKWKTLAAQEFLLPKKDKQAKLVEVFQQFDKTISRLRTQKQTLKNLKQKLLSEILG